MYHARDRYAIARVDPPAVRCATVPQGSVLRSARHLLPRDRARHHAPEVCLGLLVNIRPAEELEPADTVHARQPGGREDRVVEHRWVTEPGEQLRMRADQVVVQHVHQVAGAGAAAHRHDHRNLRVAEHGQQASRAALRAACEITGPVEHAIGYLHRISAAAEISGQPVKVLGRHGRGSGHDADAVARPHARGFSSCMCQLNHRPQTFPAEQSQPARGGREAAVLGQAVAALAI